MNKYNEQAIKNFVSGKGSVMTEEGKEKRKKNFQIRLVFGGCYYFFSLLR